MGKQDFQERKEARIDRFKRRAVKYENESNQSFKSFRVIADFIPPGQPILVGHHSESRHRSDLKRMDRALENMVKADEKAKYYAQRAESAESNNSIMSDDPNAIEKLRERLESMQESQRMMVEANKIIRSTKMSQVEKEEKLSELKFTGQQIFDLFHPRWDYYKKGYQTFELSNNSQNMSRIKKRIEALEALEGKDNKEYEVNGVKVVEDIEDNRVKLFFDGKPSFEVRKSLKGYGFRWSPRNGCWQRHYSSQAIYLANRIVNEIIN